MPNQVCIPNLFCVNTYFIISVLVFVIVYIFLSKRTNKKIYVDTATKFIESRPQDERPGLYRKVYDKLEEPTRKYDNSINVRTRGEQPSYQNIGYVYRDETDPLYNADEVNRIALYGRPDYTGSDRWEYYVLASDGIKIILDNKKEIYTDDTVAVKGFAGDWTAQVNDYQEYKYIPFLY